MHCICHVKTPTPGRKSGVIHKEKYYWLISQSRQRQKVPGNKEARNEAWIQNGHRIAVVLFAFKMCLLSPPRCEGDLPVVTAEHSLCTRCPGAPSETCPVSPDRVRTQSPRVSPGVEGRSPILRGHCLPRLLCSCSQRLAQYAEWEYSGKSGMCNSLLTPALSSWLWFIISSLFKVILHNAD